MVQLLSRTVRLGYSMNADSAAGMGAVRHGQGMGGTPHWKCSNEYLLLLAVVR